MARRPAKGRRTFGSTRLRASGRWQARYSHAGRRYEAPRTFATERDAQNWLTRTEAQILAGTWADPAAVPTEDLTAVTVGQWVRRYVDSHGATWKPSTQASSESLYRCCIAPYLGDLPLAALTRTHCREWVAQLLTAGRAPEQQKTKTAGKLPAVSKGKPAGLGPSRVRKACFLLAGACDAAVDDGLIGANPARGLKLPRLPESDPIVISPQQAAALRAAIAPRYRPLVDVLAFGGLRIGEALALRRCDVNPLRGTVTVAVNTGEIGGRHTQTTPKNHQRRPVAMPAGVMADLAAHLAGLPADPDGLVFPSRNGTPLRLRVVHAAWHKAVDAAGLPSGLTPHDLRASCGSWVAEEHGVMSAAQRLGHANSSVTTRSYARAREGAAVEVAKSLDEARRKAAENQ